MNSLIEDWPETLQESNGKNPMKMRPLRPPRHVEVHGFEYLEKAGHEAQFMKPSDIT